MSQKILILDLETTGLDANTECITEIGLLMVENLDQPRISEMYSGLEDPGKPLTEFIVNLTGITDELLKGKRIDWLRVKDMISSADYVVAHNAQFDRSFIEKRPELVGVPIRWVCSKDHVDWAELGYTTTRLNYLAADQGFVNPFAHRALFDCATTFKVIYSHIDSMIARSEESEYRIDAWGTPYDSNPALKKLGFRWDGKRKVWHKKTFTSKLEGLRKSLSEQVYIGTPLHKEVKINK